MTNADSRVVLTFILIGYALLGSLYAFLTPAWQVPDEPAHYNYIRHLVEERRLPRLEQGDYDQPLIALGTAAFIGLPDPLGFRGKGCLYLLSTLC